MPGKLVIVRHGETALNKKTATSVDADERLRGWKDVVLDEHGHLQARQLAAKFAGMKADRLVTSPLLRASETADRIGEVMGVTAERDKRLMPWNLGDLAGKKMSEVLPVMKMLQKTDTKAPGGERFSDFLHRFLPALKQYLFLAEAGHDIVLVTHTRDCQAARAWIARGMPDDFSIDERVMDDYAGEVPPCGIMVIDPQGDPGKDEEPAGEGTDPYHPDNHQVGAVVPRGGSSCASCRYLAGADNECSNTFFQAWNRDVGRAKDPRRLPTVADEYCCDNWERREKTK